MSCPSCGHDNPTGNRFCGGCGVALARACPGCGHDNPADHGFCGACGTKLGAEPVAQRVAESAPQAGARKVVSIIFADLVGSTGLHERLDAEAVQQFMDGYYGAMDRAVEAHGGRVTQHMGDGVKAVFGAPRVAEDDAIRAVRAAVDMQRAFRALAERQAGRVGRTGLRVAVNTGEVVAEEGQEIIGDPVNVAARLQEQGRDGDVVIGGATQRLVASLVTLERLGSFALKGRSEQVEAYRLVSLDSPEGAGVSEFVGRDDELFRLNLAFEHTLDAAATQLAVLVASPGLGKSRLIAEFSRRLGDAALVLSAHCNATGGASFAPIADMLRQHFGSDPEEFKVALADCLADCGDTRSTEAERARVVEGISALVGGAPAPPEETFFVVRRTLAALASAKPVVLVVDDLHWGEPLMLDLIEHLVQWGRGVPLLVVVGARPELRELRSSLLTPTGLVLDVIALAGLDAGAATRLAANVVGATDLPAPIAAKVLAASEGNPLFVAELVRMLVQQGALAKQGERWTTGVGLTEIEMPPTIHAVLAARIERLQPEESVVLERAAVVGRHFSRGTLAALLRDQVSDLDALLESLRRSELIENDSGWLFGEPVLRFHHVLIRDAAYRRLLKGTRAELHERFADWLEGRVGDAAEHHETIGYHLEQAHRFLRDLGMLGDRTEKLGERASERLAAAGRRALERDDVALAAALLGRAVDCLEAADPARAELVIDWCEALLSAGDVGTAADAVAELGCIAAREGAARGRDERRRLRAWHTCLTGHLTVLTAPRQLQSMADAVARSAKELAALGDEAGEAKAHSVHAQALARLGRVGACEAALDKALAAARKAGDRRRANVVLAGAPLAALWGPSPVTRASGRCLDVVRVLRITHGAPAVEAVALSCQGVLEALRGRTEAARRMIASSRDMIEELGMAHRLHEADVFAARVDLIEGDPVSAQRSLVRAYAGLRDMGFGTDAARAAALLGRALLAQGRAAEAETLSRESEQLAGDDLQSAIAWRGVRASAMAQRGEHAIALELALAAVEIAAATDALLDHADARLALAAALRAAGRSVEADAEERRAVELWEAKGATRLCEQANVSAAQTDQSELQVPSGGRASPRRVRPNLAAVNGERFCAAMEARDEARLTAVYSPGVDVVHHPTGSTYGAAETIAGFLPVFAARHLAVADDLIATLGDFLALVRRTGSYEGIDSELGEIGRADLDAYVVTEVDVRGLAEHVEVFDSSLLGEAVVCLYERYAERNPEGAERDRARAIARSGRAVLNMADLEHFAPVLAPDIRSSDHRNVGYGTLVGADAAIESLRALIELAPDVSWRVDDIVCLQPRALLLSSTTSGSQHIGGGAFERELLTLIVFAEDGRIGHWEQFDVSQQGEAIARFDTLVASTPRSASPPARDGAEVPVGPAGSVGSAEARGRRVRTNAATRISEGFGRTVSARDAEGLASLLAEDHRFEHRPTGTRYGKREFMTTWRSGFRAERLHFEREALASLGDAVALHRHRVKVEGLRESHLSGLGRADFDELVVIMADRDGMCRRMDLFAADRLGDALVRTYEAYAESLVESPERSRAEAIARAVAAYNGPVDLDRLAAAWSPAGTTTDHRVFGTWSSQSLEDQLRHFRFQLELAPDFAARQDDVLALDADALLFRVTYVGTAREAGGAFENPICVLLSFDENGKVSHGEVFEPEDEVEALARFDALSGHE